MITEDYVSFETAKLLKEKGFDEYGMYFYTLEDEGEEGYKSNKRLQELAHNSHPELEKRAVSCPTLQMVMKWLREVHSLWCEVSWEGKGLWCMEVFSLMDEEFISGSIVHEIKSYEEAAEAGIKYCLENLI